MANYQLGVNGCSYSLQVDAGSTERFALICLIMSSLGLQTPTLRVQGCILLLNENMFQLLHVSSLERHREFDYFPQTLE